MDNITKTLLKHGVEGIISENEDFFKQNITQALALKLNESVKEAKQEATKSILFTKIQNTQDMPELQEFVKFIENKSPRNFTFKNGSSINITESIIKDLTQLFESLNTKNRQKMVTEIFNDANSFKEHLNFSQKVKSLL